MSENIFSKKCDLCGTQPAVLFFRTFNNGTNSIQEEGLCPKCALNKFTDNSAEIENQDIIQTINQMQNVLSDIVGQISKLDSISIEECRFCKTTNSQLQKSKIAGCSYCYQEFGALIKEHTQQFSFGSKHKGAIPKRHKNAFFHQLELDKLKIKLQASLRKENYEEAILIQKRISKLEMKFSID